jgi:hypothetical protein
VLGELYPPVSFNPRVDSAYIDYHNCDDTFNSLLTFGELLSYIDSVAPGGLRTLQRLQVQWMEWNIESKLILETGESSGFGIVDLVKILFRFSGLKELQLLIFPTHDDGPHLPDDRQTLLADSENLKDCRKSIQKFLDRHKSRFRDNKAPLVTAYCRAAFIKEGGAYIPGYAYSSSTAGEKWVELPGNAFPITSLREWPSLEGGTELANIFGMAEQSE